MSKCLGIGANFTGGIRPNSPRLTPSLRSGYDEQ
jgi:hypothetical protein